jgi:nitroreductase
MDTIEAIKKRRSIRSYTGEPVPREDLETIVDAGRLAASGHNNQPWEFIVVTEREAIDALSVASAWMSQAGAIIVVVLDPSSRWWQEDGAAAMENMMLAVTALGYGSCWVEGAAMPHEETIKQLLGVPDDRRAILLLPVGVPAESPSPPKRELSEVLRWERY